MFVLCLQSEIKTLDIQTYFIDNANTFFALQGIVDMYN